MHGFQKKEKRAHPDLNQGPADLQSAALTTELCTHLAGSHVMINVRVVSVTLRIEVQRDMSAAVYRGSLAQKMNNIHLARIELATFSV